MITRELQRTIYCGDVTNEKLVGERIVINGWVQNFRDHGELTFLDVRPDRHTSACI